MEIWKEYKGYKVSNLGNVIGKFNRLLKPRLRGDYLSIRVANGDTTKGNENIHRIVGELFIPKIIGKDYINHIDGNKLNNNVSNLEWVNRSENQIHAFKNNLQKPMKGKLHPNYKHGKYIKTI